jgi:hypothetical protein
VIKNLYRHLPASKRRFVEVEPTEFAAMMDYEVELWQANHVRTHWLTTCEFLNIDNCKKPVDLTVWHIASGKDHYLNNHMVEQHMRVVFRDYHQVMTKTKAHTPSILADKKGLSVMVPPKLKRALSK